MVVLNRMALFTCLSTLVLLFAGALVTSTGSGLAVPDWPLSYGQFFPPMVGGVLFEHGHRLVAGFVAILTVIQAVLFWRLEKRPAVRALAYSALVIVLVQASLGGITVIFKLPKTVSISHAFLAQVFFSHTVLLTTFTSPFWTHWKQSPTEVTSHSTRWLALLTAGSFFVQLILGATLRHFGAGLAIPDFPKAFGYWIPPIESFAVGIHFAHRVFAFVLTGLVATLVTTVYKHYWRRGHLMITCGALMAFIGTQLILGAMVIWLKRPAPLTSLHLVTGAICLGFGVSLAAQLFRLESRELLPQGETAWTPV